MLGETENTQETPYERGVRMAESFVQKQVGDVGLHGALERMRIERDSVEYFAKHSAVNRGMFDAYGDFIRRHIEGLGKPSGDWMDRAVSKKESSSQSQFLF